MKNPISRSAIGLVVSALATACSYGDGTGGLMEPVASSGAAGTGASMVSGSAGVPGTAGGATGAGVAGSTTTGTPLGGMAGATTTGIPTSTGTAGATVTGTAGGGMGGGAAAAGSPSVGGAANGGMTSGGTASGGATSGGATTGGGGGGGTSVNATGPCDIYAEGGTPCVAAYSTIRVLSSTYTGPLYQVRSGSNAMNTGSGGEVHDIGITADGFADAAAQDAVCEGTTCTVSILYDQSGMGNDLTVAKKGRADGGEFGDDDDFESIANDGPLTVGGHDVYSLYMETRQGYRQTIEGEGVPRGEEPQGIYMLADGTRAGTACCWDFGNVSPDPTRYGVMNTLFLGVAYWGRGAGSGPWFGADFEAGVWMGGSNPGEPGWGGLNDAANAPPNDNNPSMRVPFALGFLKTETNYALRMADLETASALTTAYDGLLPKDMANEGAIVIGVGGDNSNNSFGTFYEGAVVAGYPSDATELSVMQNVQAVGYAQ